MPRLQSTLLIATLVIAAGLIALRAGQTPDQDAIHILACDVAADMLERLQPTLAPPLDHDLVIHLTPDPSHPPAIQLLNQYLPGDPDLVAHVIALDAIAIVVHKDSPIQSLTADQLRRVFQADITNAADLDGRPAPITPLARPHGHPFRCAFDSHFDNRRDMPVTSLTGPEHDVIHRVARDESAIAFVSWSAAMRAVAAGEPIRLLAIDTIRPTLANIRSGHYPYTLPLTLVHHKNPPEPVSRLINACRAAHARRIWRELSIIPATREDL